MKIVVKGGQIVNEGRIFTGSLLIDGDTIVDVSQDKNSPIAGYDMAIDATDCYVLPGIIDEHVHFREPGLTDKADIQHESRAAAFGGVTSFFDMPNTLPQTTSLQALDEKFQNGRENSHINYSFFFGATNSNSNLLAELPRHRIPGIKVFMGASTGNMLVDDGDSLNQIFSLAADLDIPLMTHCEDSELINSNMKKAIAQHGDDPGIVYHSQIRSAEACYKSSSQAVRLAKHYGTHLHVAHLSTEKELSLFDPVADWSKQVPQITAEAVISHLIFSDHDYTTKKALIKCNPAVKTLSDRDALRKALTDGRIGTIGTDHAPHLWREKQGGCKKAMSGMPMVQFSLPCMLELVDQNILTVERVIDLMVHHPARLFQIRNRGFLRKGFKADVAIVRPHSPWKVTKEIIQSKCEWSPLLGQVFNWKVEKTICNGRLIYDNGAFDTQSRGEELEFR